MTVNDTMFFYCIYCILSIFVRVIVPDIHARRVLLVQESRNLTTKSPSLNQFLSAKTFASKTIGVSQRGEITPLRQRWVDVGWYGNFCFATPALSKMISH